MMNGRRDVKTIERDILAAKNAGDKAAEAVLREELREWWREQSKIVRDRYDARY